MHGDIAGHTRNLDNGSFGPYAGTALSSQNGKFLVDAYSITVFLVVWVLTSCDEGRASSVENLVVVLEYACEGLRPSNIWQEHLNHKICNTFAWQHYIGNLYNRPRRLVHLPQ